MTTAQLFRYLPDKLKGTEGSVLRSLLEAIATGDESSLSLLAEARKELFLTTATGSYLINLAASQGFTLPQNSGLDTVGFRKLAIPAISLPKQATSTFNKVVEVFYATNILHPSFTCSTAEPYNLVEGDEIVFATESSSVQIVFKAEQFSDISNVTAAELAGIINSAQTTVFADIFFDRTNSITKLRVTSRAFGAAARLSVSGGSAQNVFKFPNLKPTTGSAGTAWNLSKDKVYTDSLKFEWNGSGIDPQVFLLDIGDIVTIRGVTDAGGYELSKLNGSFKIKDVSKNWFIISDLAFPHSSAVFTQASADTLVFTSLETRSLYNNKEYALISETKIGEVIINIPAVPPIVRRDLRGGWHLHGAVYEVLDIGNDGVTVQYPNNLPDNGRFVIKTQRFTVNLQNRFFYYDNKAVPVGSTQKLLLSALANQFPALQQSVSQSALAGVIDPIFADLDSLDFIVTTPIPHYFENHQEVTIAGATLNPPETVAAPNTIVVPGIPLPIGQSYTVFTHNAGRRDLYVCFNDQSDEHEIYNFDYMPDPSDLLNKTRIFYGPEQQGRTVKAITLIVNPVYDPSVGSVVVGPVTLSSAGGTVTLPHNLGSANVAFRVLDANNMPVWGVNRSIDINTSSFTHAALAEDVTISALCIDFNKYQPVPGYADPNIAKKIISSVHLPASPVEYSYVDVTHGLLTTSIVAEIKVVSNAELPYPPRMFALNNSQLRIAYAGTMEEIIIDVFVAYASDFPVIDSVSGGILTSEVNGPHVIDSVINKYSYVFQILDSTGVPKRYKGAQVGAFDVEHYTDPTLQSDVRFVFPDEQSRLNAGFITGTKVRLLPNGSDIQSAAAFNLRSHYLSVQSQFGEAVYFKSRVISNPGTIISGAKCVRASYLGGSTFSQYLNKASSWNTNEFFKSSKLILASSYIESNSNYVGSYIYDTRGDKATYVVSKIATTLLQPIQAASSPEFIIVSDASEFIDGSYVFLDHGNSNIEGPVKIVNKVIGNPGQLVVDRSYVFKKQHDQGAIVRMLRSNSIIALEQNGNQYPLYLTGVTAARNTVQKILRDMAASGITVNVALQLPDIRYLDTSLNPFE